MLLKGLFYPYFENRFWLPTASPLGRAKKKKKFYPSFHYSQPATFFIQLLPARFANCLELTRTELQNTPSQFHHLLLLYFFINSICFFSVSVFVSQLSPSLCTYIYSVVYCKRHGKLIYATHLLQLSLIFTALIILSKSINNPSRKNNGGSGKGNVAEVGHYQSASQINPLITVFLSALYPVYPPKSFLWRCYQKPAKHQLNGSFLITKSPIFVTHQSDWV